MTLANVLIFIASYMIGAAIGLILIASIIKVFDKRGGR